jgi:hypothetical protein
MRGAAASEPIQPSALDYVKGDAARRLGAGSIVRAARARSSGFGSRACSGES